MYVLRKVSYSLPRIKFDVQCEAELTEDDPNIILRENNGSASLENILFSDESTFALNIQENWQNLCDRMSSVRQHGWEIHSVAQILA